MAKKILLVDDESAVLFAYKKVLQGEQFTVDAIDSMDGALELLRVNSYDVAILDLRLKGESSEEGFELLKHIKGNYPATRTIMITANGNQEVRDKASSLGADRYFEKPVSTASIREALAVSEKKRSAGSLVDQCFTPPMSFDGGDCSCFTSEVSGFET